MGQWECEDDDSTSTQYAPTSQALDNQANKGFEEQPGKKRPRKQQSQPPQNQKSPINVNYSTSHSPKSHQHILHHAAHQQHAETTSNHAKHPESNAAEHRSEQRYQATQLLNKQRVRPDKRTDQSPIPGKQPFMKNVKRLARSSRPSKLADLPNSAQDTNQAGGTHNITMTMSTFQKGRRSTHATRPRPIADQMDLQLVQVGKRVIQP